MWRDSLRSASFRGVPFLVETGTLDAGRRLARHEYPQRDIPYLEDMGRKAREYKVDGYVVGADYMWQRDDLLNAVEQAGAGQLVHPWHGTISVTVSNCQLTESTQHGGLAKFSLTFIEAGQQLEPGAGVDTEAALSTQFGECEMAFTDDFAENFSIAGLPEFAVQDALGGVTSLLGMPGMGMGQLGWVRSNPVSPLGSLLPENLFDSLFSPRSLASGVISLITGALDVMSLFGFELPMASQAATPTRIAQNRNTQALNNLVLQTATTRRINDLATTTPATLDDARIARAEIVSRADTVLLSEGTGQRAADSILQLRTAAVNHFSAIQPLLPRLVSVTPQASRPAVVLAHDFYGDNWYESGRDSEIVMRNSMRHPGFVPSGYPLELVS